MPKKVFCSEKTSASGKRYFQGFGGHLGKITVFVDATRKSDGADLVIVNIARPNMRGYKKVTRGGVSSRRSWSKGYPSNRRYYKS